MLEIITIALFCWLFFLAIRLALKLTWGAVKIIAVLLCIFALPALLACLLFAGGILLLLPLLPVIAALVILKLGKA